MLGPIAGFIGAFAFAPQAFKILRDRDASGVSALTYAMVLSGALLWGAYGVFRGAPRDCVVEWCRCGACGDGAVFETSPATRLNFQYGTSGSRAR